MIRTSGEMRAAARESLSGNWGGAVVLTLVYMLITSVCSVIPVVGNLLAVLLLPMGWGYTMAFLSNKRTGDAFELGTLFEGFNDYLRILGTLLLQSVYTLLWMLLLIVPGIIKSYSYYMTSYILKDEPELAYNAAIEKSMAMMEGHKFDLFYLHLTFIGWYLLCIPTLGIGLLWVMPYVSSATAHFYEDVKEDYAKRTGGCI